MPKQKYILYVDAPVIEALQKVAAADHMEGPKFAALVLSKWSDLKPGNGLNALASLPQHLFRARPGRPPTTPGNTEPHEVATS